MGRDRANWWTREEHPLVAADTCVGSGVVLLQNNARAVKLQKRDNRCKDFISISGCIEVAISNDQLNSVSGSDATPHNDGPSPITVSLHDTRICIAFFLTSVHPLAAI
jgi:hypothetical protein